MTDRLIHALTRAISEAPQHHRGALATIQAAQAGSPILAVRVGRFLQEAGSDLSPELVSELGSLLGELHGTPVERDLPRERGGKYFVEVGLVGAEVDLLDHYCALSGGISRPEGLRRLVLELEGR